MLNVVVILSHYSVELLLYFEMNVQDKYNNNNISHASESYEGKDERCRNHNLSVCRTSYHQKISLLLFLILLFYILLPHYDYTVRLNLISFQRIFRLCYSRYLIVQRMNFNSRNKNLILMFIIVHYFNHPHSIHIQIS